jgi:glycosyltransferase involved in cell wall biosynthesis
MKILILGSEAQSLLNFRGELLRDLAQRGHEVIAGAPNFKTDQRIYFENAGIRSWESNMLHRTGLNPVSDLLAEAQLYEFCRDERIELLLAYTIKPIVLGLPASARAGVPQRIALITGLGSGFFARGLVGKFLKSVVAILYRRALRYSTKIIAQNEDIITTLQSLDVIGDVNKVSVVRGSGVDTRHYAWRPLRLDRWCLLLVARMLYDKGVLEFVEAARALKKMDTSLRFVLLGALDSNPSSISKEQIEEWENEGVVEYFPAVQDVRPFLEEATVLIHPSYHEGLPRAVLEAMAVGRPIITTNAIGCRDTLFGVGEIDREGIAIAENGIMVQVGEPGGIVAAVRYLIARPQLTSDMASRGRRLAEDNFDVRIINERMVALVEEYEDLVCIQSLV